MAPGNVARHALEYLSADTINLARPMPSSDPHNILYVVGDAGGVRVDPAAPEFDRARHQVVFGRDDQEAAVHIGDEDPEVSRRHGLLYFDDRHWHLRNTGRLGIRLPSSKTLLTDDSVRLPHAYFPIFLDTPRGGQSYIVEVRVTGHPVRRRTRTPGSGHLNTTITVGDVEGAPDPSLLSDEDRLVVIVLAKRYLEHRPSPVPLTYEQISTTLELSRPNTYWTAKAVTERIARIRARLIHQGAYGLRAKDFDDDDKHSLGNTLNHNLVMLLIGRGAITPGDLRRLDVADD